MNVGGGEAADQMVRMMLSGTEVMVRLSGSALKNLLALTMALASNRKTLSGKVNMGKMLRETRDLRRFPMTPQQYKQFKKLAKKHKLLYSVIKDKDDKGKLMDVILPATELDRANAIFERILYTLPPEPERKPAKPLQQVVDPQQGVLPARLPVVHRLRLEAPALQQGLEGIRQQDLVLDNQNFHSRLRSVRVLPMIIIDPFAERKLKAWLFTVLLHFGRDFFSVPSASRAILCPRKGCG